MNLEGFKDYLISLDCSELTISAYTRDMKHFATWFEQTNGHDFRLQNLTSIDVREYKQWLLLHKKSRPATINRKLASIRMFTKWGVDTKQISFDPIKGVKSVKEQPLSPKWLTKQEQAAILRELERQILTATTPVRRFESIRNRCLVLLMLNTGMRLTECSSLEITDITISDRKGQLIVQNGKGGITRIIPLNLSARKAIYEWMQIRPDSTSNKLFISKNGNLEQRAIQKILNNIGEKSHVHLSPHLLRHSFAKNLLNTNNVSLDKVGQICGHKSLDSTKIYTVGSLQDLQASVNLLDE